MKIMFMGTPDFSVECLKALMEAGHEICSVVTTPDKPRGRGHKMCTTAVGEFANENNLMLHKPINLKKENFEDILTKDNPDVIVVVAYGKLLPPYVLEFPKYGCINVHASLLPKYRGAAPIQHSIIDGEKQTGVTTMYMAEGLDTGDMLLKSYVDIENDDNFETLHDKLAISGARLIADTLDSLSEGTLVREVQDDKLSNYAAMITKETAHIDWTKSSEELHNLIRGLFPIPKAFTFYESKQLKICKSELCDIASSDKAGTVSKVENDAFYVACGDNKLIKIIAIQMEGKKMMPVSDYLKGNTIMRGTILGG